MHATSFLLPLLVAFTAPSLASANYPPHPRSGDLNLFDSFPSNHYHHPHRQHRGKQIQNRGNAVFSIPNVLQSAPSNLGTIANNGVLADQRSAGFLGEIMSKVQAASRVVSREDLTDTAITIATPDPTNTDTAEPTETSTTLTGTHTTATTATTVDPTGTTDPTSTAITSTSQSRTIVTATTTLTATLILPPSAGVAFTGTAATTISSFSGGGILGGILDSLTGNGRQTPRAGFNVGDLGGVLNDGGRQAQGQGQTPNIIPGGQRPGFLPTGQGAEISNHNPPPPRTGNNGRSLVKRHEGHDHSHCDHDHDYPHSHGENGHCDCAQHPHIHEVSSSAQDGAAVGVDNGTGVGSGNGTETAMQTATWTAMKGTYVVKPTDSVSGAQTERISKAGLVVAGVVAGVVGLM